MFGFYSNYNVYESDILRMGGSVRYTNRVFASSFHSTLEEAVVSLGDYSCVVHMERYRKGMESVVVQFAENGVVKKCIDYEDARQFMILYNFLILKDDSLLVYTYRRKVKTYFTFILQILCAFTFFSTLCFNVFCRFSLLSFAMCIFSVICFFALGSLYYFWRESKL